MIIQAVIDCVVKPPTPGDISYDQYMKEKSDVLHSLKLRAKMVADTINDIDGMSSNPLQGAMYAFPKVIFLFHIPHL